MKTTEYKKLPNSANMLSPLMIMMLLHYYFRSKDEFPGLSCLAQREALQFFLINRYLEEDSIGQYHITIKGTDFVQKLLAYGTYVLKTAE